MVDVPHDGQVDELTQARMDIIGLKLSVQALTIFIAHTRAKSEMGNEVKIIYETILRGVDNIDFSDEKTADIWKEQVRKSINNTFGSLLAVGK